MRSPQQKNVLKTEKNIEAYISDLKKLATQKRSQQNPAAQKSTNQAREE